MAHKLLDDKIATFTFPDWFHEEEVKQASLMLAGKPYLVLLFTLVGVMLLFVNLM